MRQKIKPRLTFNLFKKVFCFSCEIAGDGLWDFRSQQDKHEYTYTDFLAFGMIKREGDEDITLFRLVLGPLMLVFGIG